MNAGLGLALVIWGSCVQAGIFAHYGFVDCWGCSDMPLLGRAILYGCAGAVGWGMVSLHVAGRRL